MNICILGGGNIGTALLGDLASGNQDWVGLYTQRPEAWCKEIEVFDNEQGTVTTSKIDAVTDDPSILQHADMILSTLPSNVFTRKIEELEAYIRPGTYLGIIPGSGGCEFCCQKLLDKGCVVFGFQRVHVIARIKEYGKSVVVTSRKKDLFLGAIPNSRTREVCDLIAERLQVPCHPLKNYMCVTLTPSNPILHTTRLYAMFRDYQEGVFYDRNFLFYEEWNEDSSAMLLACDEELQNICRAYDQLDLHEVISLKVHYESDTVEKMTKKIRGIQAFKGITSPMIRTEQGYIPDRESRYFKEDYSYGLCIIKAFAEIVQVDTPNIDQVLKWYGAFAHCDSEDLKKGNLPQNYGMNRVQDIYAFYQK